MDLGSPTGRRPSLRTPNTPTPSVTPTKKFLSRRPSQAPPTPTIPTVDVNDLLFDLSSIRNYRPHLDGFRPVAGFKIPSHPQSCVFMSDIGFLASSSGSALLMVDMRGPEILHWNQGNKKGKQKEDPSAITSLVFTVSAIGDGEAPPSSISDNADDIRADRDRTPRLIVVQASGTTRVFEFSHVVGDWIVSATPTSFSHDNVAGAFVTFVIDKAGIETNANARNLEAALAHQASFTTIDDGKGALNSIWITVTSTTVAAYANIDGHRTAMYEDRDGFEAAQIIMRFGCPVLAVASRNRSVTILSLPELLMVTKLRFDAAVQYVPLSLSLLGRH